MTLLAQRSGDPFSFLIGQARAGADGHWSAVSTALSEGAYTITAHAVAPDGQKGSAPVLIGGSARALVVDTTGPRVTGATLDPGTSRVRVSFADNLSGLDPRGLARSTFAQVTASGTVPIPIRPASIASAGRSVTFGLGHPLPPGRYALRIASTAVRDAAGNALDGEFQGAFATGDGRPGGDFAALFQVSKTTASPPRPV